MRKGFISVVVVGILLMSVNMSTSETLSPLWSYRIENMTDFAMSRNGEYVVVACETGPLCEKGQYYVFDRYGNTATHGCIEGEITAVDVADNGAFFVGTRTGYYFSSSSGRIHEDTDVGSMFESVSVSEHGEVVVAGTNKEILIFDSNGIRSRKEVSWPVSSTTINDSGDTVVAGTVDTIFLYKESTNKWLEHQTNSKSISLAVSDDGNTIICGMGTGTIWILDSELRIQKGFPVSGLTSIAMTADGKYFVCGTRKGKIYYFNSFGEQIWSRDVKDTISDISISSDGSLVAVPSGNVLLFDSSGKKLQELKSSETIQRMYFSKFGEILSYITNGELIFLELSEQSRVWNYEQKLPSRKSIPLDDQLTEVWSYVGTPHSVITADVNGDGQKEIICSFTKEIVVLNSEGKVLWKKSFNFGPDISAMDVTEDFIPEVIVKSDDRRMGFYVFDGEGQELANHEFYRLWHSEPPPQGYDLGIIPLWSGDIDKDGVIEVICQLHAGYALNPRGFYAFEYPSFKEEWYYPVASTLATIHFVDIDGDGQVEILAGSEGPCNGRQVGSTDDCHAYIYAVTLQGEELWTKQIGPEGYKRIYIAVVDLNGDGNLEIVGGGWSFEDNWGTLFILDSEGNYTVGKENGFDHSVFLESIADMDNDGKLEILTSSPPSTLVLYDYKLREIRRKDVSITLSYLAKALVNDIDADLEKEIILTSDDKKLLILNNNLEEEWDKTFPSYDKYLKAAIVNLNRCKNYLLVLSDKLYAYTYSNNPQQPCVPWVITKQEKINEIENSLEEARKYLEQGNVAQAAEYVSQAEETYRSIRSEGGLEEYYKEIEDMKEAIKVSLTETPPPTTSPPTTTPPPTTSPPTTTPADGWSILEKTAVICSIAGFILAILVLLYQKMKKETRQEEIPSKETSLRKIIGEEPLRSDFEFDIAISFAGEDREIAEELASKLRTKDIEVFYDRFFKGELWGKELTKYFQDVYGPKTRFVVVLISEYYPIKDWTDFEFSIMREEAKKRKTEFILPVRIDDTEIEGIKPDVAYLDFQKEKIDGIVNCLIEKLSKPLDQKPPEEDEK